jgi:two-component system alkaline phosphatase synthesis response regulator PhoP
MAANSTLLCIHRDPAQLSFLQENGYDLVTATNGHDGLRLFMSRPVDAIVVEYHLGLLDGATIATEIKQVRPNVPIVMLADDVELPADALKCVDAFVAKSDGVHFLWATMHFVLTVKPAQQDEGRLRSPASTPRRHGKSGQGAERWRAMTGARSAVDGRDVPFSSRLWRNIRNGNIQF